MRCKEKNEYKWCSSWRRDEVKTGLCLSFLFKVEEVSIYLYADGKDPVEREKADDAGEKGKDCWSHVLE